jgi:Na+/H+ antiporter NhaD/arsenite permease-like protein
LRFISPRVRDQPEDRFHEHGSEKTSNRSSGYVCVKFPINFVTGPLIADLFLLAILAIGEQEVREGTVGAHNISPLDIMLFFISLAYIAISIDASGIIRFLAFKVLTWGGKTGHRLFFYLYTFWFALTAFVGNDPVILSGTAFLAYMTRVSSNIVHPRAWIFSQFAVANIGSAILVSSNPTNLVLAGAFEIRFIEYTAYMIVPVIVTGIVLFPFLLYIVFNDESLVPQTINLHELPAEARARKPVNPNIPHARGTAEQQEDAPGEEGKLLSLEEIMNPFLDRKGAAFGAVVMAATLVAVLAYNASTTGTGAKPVFYVTLPAAAVMFSWDVSFGWIHRRETRRIAREGREELERLRREREEEMTTLAVQGSEGFASSAGSVSSQMGLPRAGLTHKCAHADANPNDEITAANTPEKPSGEARDPEGSGEKAATPREASLQQPREKTTLESLARDFYVWCQETFPTATAVISHLPFALVPFAFSMFVLVQALVTKGWVQIFALGWDAWVRKTGTIGAIGGMGFLSVVLCNVCFLMVPSSEMALTEPSLSSSPAPTSAPPSCSPASSKHGKSSTTLTTSNSASARSGRRSTRWRWASTSAPSAPRSAPRWPVSSGGISSRRSTSASDGSTLRG